jgi:Zn-dependent peptidase ImmA (M78 family)
MNPEHEERRKIIREWMSLSKDRRQTEEQANAFANKVIERIPSVRDPYGR